MKGKNSIRESNYNNGDEDEGKLNYLIGLVLNVEGM